MFFSLRETTIKNVNRCLHLRGTAETNLEQNIALGFTPRCRPNGVLQRSFGAPKQISKRGLFLRENQQISDQIRKYAILWLASKSHDIAQRDDGAIVK